MSDDRMLRLLKEAREQLEFERRRRTEPIAIVGIGCRLPGGISNPSRFWELLVEGVDATGDVPVERWDAGALYDADPSVPGKCYVTRGGFLQSIDGFEPEFFGISPREATALDPQQRLLLEVTWEALENARLSPSALRGSNTGVWVGLSLDDYAKRSVPAGQLERIDAYTALGNARSVAAGRIAYVLGLHGPVMQLDTACSSSLVAVHLACQSLRAGECGMALVGGVNVMASPEASVALCKLQALSRDGRCKTFDAAADGYGRGEGCGVVVLKTLSAAEAAGDRIWAVIRGSAINHDGASNGLTAPNGLAQEAVIRAALSNAGVSALDIGYVEAHGTGTLLGDPIEVMALNRVYGVGRAPETPLYLGSVKTNLGHLEAAAGITALIKTTLCLSKSQLVPSLHCASPNPKIPWHKLPVRVATTASAWPRQDLPRMAGVSSFGISGTNAHLVVEAAAPPAPKAELATRSAELVVLSARTDAALRESAQRLAEHLRANPTLPLSDVAYSAATTRSLMERRLPLVVPTRRALLDALQGLEEDRAAAAPHEFEERAGRGKLAWVFTGGGAQRHGMGQELYREWTVFQEALDEAFAALNPHLEVRLQQVMWEDQPSIHSRLHQTAFMQPALLAYEWAMAALFRSWGVHPDFVLGHSIGEITAACVAGVFSLQDAARLVCARGRLMQALPSGGAMLAIGTTQVDVAHALKACGEGATIAAINGPASLVVSGKLAAVELLAAYFTARGVETKRLAVSHASHSALMDPMLEDLQIVAESITFRPPTVPLISTVTGKRAGIELTSPQYWARHVREPVEFALGIQALHAAGVGSYLEIGPQTSLLPAVAETLSDHSPVLMGTGRRSSSESSTALEALARWLSEGGTVQWSGVFPNGGRRCDLPSYSWQRKRYWVEPSYESPVTEPATDHPLLGARLSSPHGIAFETLLSVSAFPWLSEHRVVDAIVVPAAALLELMRAAAEDPGCEITDAVFSVPLIVPDRGVQRVQVLLSEEGTRASVYSVAAAPRSHQTWSLHATATVSRSNRPKAARIDIAALRRRVSVPVDVDATYSSLDAVGLRYGPVFRGLKRIWRAEAEVLAELELAAELEGARYGIHPALLDAALQSIAGGLITGQHGGALLPFEIGRFALHQSGATSVLVHARLAASDRTAGLSADLALFDRDGGLVAEISDLRARPVDLSTFGIDGARAPTDACFRIDWHDARTTVPEAPLLGRWALVASGDGALDQRLLAEMAATGASAELVTIAQLSSCVADHVVQIWPPAGEADAALRAAQRGLAIVQALPEGERAPRLWWVTRAAVATSPAEDTSLVGACVWGLGRTLQQERPALRCTLLDLDENGSVARALRREASVQDDETQIAWRGQSRLVARLVRAAAPPAARRGEGLPEAKPLRTEGTVLVTGGLGGLGLEVAKSLARRGVRHLLLVGRRGRSTPGANEAVSELEALGARVTVANADVADRAALAAIIAGLSAEFPLRGVVHAAGLLDDGLLVDQTAERFARVFAPKVGGAWNLHELTAHLELDLFLLFSSCAGSFGSASQGAYSAANAFLDALASHRRRRGLVGQSWAWGPWAERGLAASLDGAQKARLANQGLGFFKPSQAIALFEASLSRPESQLVLTLLDIHRLSQAFAGNIPPFWRALVRSPPFQGEGGKTNWATELAALSVEQRGEAMTRRVRAEVARVLSFRNLNEVPPDKPLKDLGFDSLMAVELANALGRRTGSRIPATLALNHPTPAAIAEYLLRHMLAPQPRLPSPAVTAEGPQPRADNDDPFGRPREGVNRVESARRERMGNLELGESSPAFCERLNQLENPRARLFCFHQAGGAATSFEPFCELGSAGVEVHAISHTRTESATAEYAERYLDHAVSYIRDHSQAPYCLFGHSLGGYFAWRVLEQLVATGARLPRLFVPSAASFPWPVQRSVSTLELDGLFRQVAAGAAQADFLKEAFSADVRLWLAFPERQRRPQAVPIAAFVGAQDHLASKAGMRVWAKATTQEFTLSILPGSHFYLADEGSRALLLENLAARMSKW